MRPGKHTARISTSLDRQKGFTASKMALTSVAELTGGPLNAFNPIHVKIYRKYLTRGFVCFFNKNYLPCICKDNKQWMNNLQSCDLQMIEHRFCCRKVETFQAQDCLCLILVANGPATLCQQPRDFIGSEERRAKARNQRNHRHMVHSPQVLCIYWLFVVVLAVRSSPSWWSINFVPRWCQWEDFIAFNIFDFSQILLAGIIKSVVSIDFLI